MRDDDEPVDSLGAYAAPRTSIGPIVPGSRERLLRSAFAGVTAASLTGVLAGVPYVFAVRSEARLDWAVVVPIYVAFCVGFGALVGLGVALGVALADRLTHGRSLAAATLGATMGGAAAAMIPGAMGTAYFGSQNAPFMGTTAIAALPFVGVLLASTLIADVDARSRRGPEASSALFVAARSAVLASVPFGVLSVLAVALVDDETALAMFRSGADAAHAYDDATWSGLARVGAVYGTALGAALGLHVGLTIVLVRRVANGADTKRVEPDAAG